jgi:hypothetical protein
MLSGVTLIVIGGAAALVLPRIRRPAKVPAAVVTQEASTDRAAPAASPAAPALD